MPFAAIILLFVSSGCVLGIPHNPIPDLGMDADMNGKLVFPADNPWNKPVDKLPVDPQSDAIIAKIGLDKPLHPDFGGIHHAGAGMPYVVVRGGRVGIPDVFEDADHSDPGPYPVPLDCPIEGGQDGKGSRHIIVVDRDDWKLYEMSAAYRESDGWAAHAGAIFDLTSNEMRPEGWPSADAAGLPIFPGLVRYDEVFQHGHINHALRFTVRHTRHACIPPARHYTSHKNDKNLPPMGMRVRLKADFDISHFPAQARVILTALKKYGMIVADEGSDWYLSGTADPRWDDAALDTLEHVKGSDFEVVQMDGIITDVEKDK